MSEVEAQLSPLRSPQISSDNSKLSEARITVSEWNTGFFVFRRVKIVLGNEATTSQMQIPGSWIPWESETGAERSIPQTRRN